MKKLAFLLLLAGIFVLLAVSASAGEIMYQGGGENGMYRTGYTGAINVELHFKEPFNLADADYLYLRFFVEDPERYANNGQIEITSSGKCDAEEYNWDVGSFDMQAGWNEWKIDLFAGQTAGGTPDIEKINYFRIYFFTEGENLVALDYVAFGGEKELNIPRIEPCTDCKGTGCAPGTTPEVCPDCGGSGQVRTTQRTPFGMAQTMSACPKCHGSGKIIHQPCKTCRGMGSVRRAKKMTVKVPAGIDDGQTISRQGAGNAGANGGPAGDLLITVIVRPHAIFERDGTSILMEQDISFTQAALGAEVEVPTLDGKVKLTIPEGTQPGAVFRLKGKGVPYLRGSGRGDQFVSVNVRIPKNMNSTQKEALRHYAETMGEEHSKGSGIFGKKKR